MQFSMFRTSRVWLSASALMLLVSCGGGGGGNDAPPPPVVPKMTTINLSSAAVKGPLTNALVKIYQVDITAADLKGEFISTTQSDDQAWLHSISVIDVKRAHILEYEAIAGTIDVTTGKTPVIKKLRTLLTPAMIESVDAFYATPLTTLSLDMLGARRPISAGALTSELAKIGVEINSSLLVGLRADIDYFTTPPLLTSSTTTVAQQQQTAQHRGAIEAVSALLFQLQAQFDTLTTDQLLASLAADLGDGEVDAKQAGEPLNTYSLSALKSIAADLNGLQIPNDTRQRRVSDMPAILIAEKLATGGGDIATAEFEAAAYSGQLTGLVTKTDFDNDGELNAVDVDDDGDGVADADDALPYDATESLDTDGDGTGNNADTDDDNDSVLDAVDAFPLDKNESVDTDGDGTGNNADTDDDNDSVLDAADAFPLNKDESLDTDGDGSGNNADTDDDNDSVLDAADAFPLDKNESVDTDGDGTGNNADTDDDNDSVLDAADAFPLDKDESVDTDGDGTGNNADTDDDDDGVLDANDFAPLDPMITEAPVPVAGGGVKGPLVNAVVSVYLLDAKQANFRGALVASATTDSAARIQGLALPSPLTPPYLMQFTSNDSTTDLTTGKFPVISTLKTILTAKLLTNSEAIYATPLTDMAVLLAMKNADAVSPYGGNADGVITNAEVVAALSIAAQQVKSTLGFGVDESIDIFDTPPVLDDTRSSLKAQSETASYRSAVEAMTAIVFQLKNQAGGENTSTNDVILALAGDLADGSIDGMIGGVKSTAYVSEALGVFDQDPGSLPIPGDPNGRKVSDVKALVISETASLGSSVDTQSFKAIKRKVRLRPAVTKLDSDDDGVLNALDAFPDDISADKDTDADGLPDVRFTLVRGKRTTTVDAANSDQDDDGDGVLDVNDKFSLDLSEWLDTDNDGTGDNADTDDDGDGVADADDDFPLDASKSSITDADNDGWPVEQDANDADANIPGVAFVDTDGDGVANSGGIANDNDDDNDGVLDAADAFPLDKNEQSDLDGDKIGDNADDDIDGDSISNLEDLFPFNKLETLDNDFDGIGNNADKDDDGDGLGDKQESRLGTNPLLADTDGDGVLDGRDPAPLDASKRFDLDRDLVADEDDNCPLLPNPKQIDTDKDSQGNVCDEDDDNDGVFDTNDRFPINASEIADTDKDGVGNAQDTDDDNDGIIDSADAFPLDPSEFVDTDGDGSGNNSDADDDGDGVLDVNDAFPLDKDRSVIVDQDNDGWPTDQDVDDNNADLPGTAFIDADGDGIGNETDADDDNDGVLDADDAFPLDAKEYLDTDGDGIGDSADLDIDNDGVLNEFDAFPFDDTEVSDNDADGLGNVADDDDDNDGVLDVDDDLPFNASEFSDRDGDGVGDNSDLDIDGDGEPNDTDALPLDPAHRYDFDGDGVSDEFDADNDDDGVSDLRELKFNLDPFDASDALLDSDGDGFLNSEEANSNTDPFDAADNKPSVGEIEFEAANYNVAETEAFARISVHRILGAAGEASVEFSTLDIPGLTPGVDYAAVTKTLTWAPGDKSIQFVDVPIINDEIIQGEQIFRVMLSGASDGVKLGRETAIVTVIDDELGFPDEGVIISDFDHHIEEGIGYYAYTLRRVFGAKGDAWLDLRFENSGASAQDLSLRVNWRHNEFGAKTVYVPVDDNDIANSYQLFFARSISNSENLVSRVFTNVRIIDEDQSNPAGALGFSSRRFRGEEGEGQFPVRLLRRYGSAGVVEVTFTAEYNNDAIEDVSQTIVWADGDAQPKLVSIPYPNNSQATFASAVVLSYVVESGNVRHFSNSDAGLGFRGRSFIFIRDGADINLMLDTDGDGEADVVDIDDDGDGVNDVDDFLPLDASEQFDTDNDRLGDNADSDDDNDFVPDDQDAYPLDRSESRDTDNDGIGDGIDADADGDGIADYLEQRFGLDFLEASDADKDPDGDGFTNREELNSGSNHLLTDSLPGAGIIEFVYGGYVAAEGSPNTTIAVSRYAGAAGAATISYELNAITATEGEDYDALIGTITWAPGEIGIKEIELLIRDDSETEITETARISMATATPGISLGRDSALVSIYDNDKTSDGLAQAGAIVLNADAKVSEQLAEMEVVFWRVEGSDGEVAIRPKLASSSGQFADSATIPNIHFNSNADLSFRQQFPGQVIRWQDGELGPKTLIVNIDPDRRAEETEQFRLSADAVVGDIGFISDGAVLEIVDMDFAYPGGRIGFVERMIVADSSETGIGVGISRQYGIEGAAAATLKLSDIDGEIVSSHDVSWTDQDGETKTINIDLPGTDVSEVYRLELALVSGKVQLDRLSFGEVFSNALLLVLDQGLAERTTDTDRDGQLDMADLDDDNDGVRDHFDDFPKDAAVFIDTDRDGIADLDDTDSDNDGMSDSYEDVNGLNRLDASDRNQDKDGDGARNYTEFLSGTDSDNADDFPQKVSELSFSDRDLEACVHATKEFVVSMDELSCFQKNIVSLEGIEQLTALKELDLERNRIVDLSPLVELELLEELYLSSNEIEVVPALSTTLRRIFLSNNNISSLAWLPGLTALEIIDLGANNITAVPPISDLILLKILSFSSNSIDVFEAGPLVSLEKLSLTDNHLQDDDLEALAEVSAHGYLNTLEINNNAITNFDFVEANLNVIDLRSDKERVAPLLVEFAPESVDLEKGRSIIITATFPDEISLRRMVLVSPSGLVETLSTFGSRASLSFDQYSERGEWRIHALEHTGGHRYNDFAISQLLGELKMTFTVVGPGEGDISPPTIKRLELDGDLDLSDGPLLRELNLVVEDLGSGVTNTSMSIAVSGHAIANRSVNGSALTVRMPIGFANEEIEIKSIYSRDRANNQVSLDGKDLAEKGVLSVLKPVNNNVQSEVFDLAFLNRALPSKSAYQFELSEASLIAVKSLEANRSSSIRFEYAEGRNFPEGSVVRLDDRAAIHLPPGLYRFVATRPSNSSSTGTYAFEIIAKAGSLSNFKADSDSDGVTDDIDEDIDGDGISNAQEQALGLNPLFAGDASFDSDGDGATNLEELLAQSDPLDKTSVPLRLGDIDFPDEGLTACLVQQRYQSSRFASSIKRLSCRGGYIRSLEGLEFLVGLERLDLSQTKLENVAALEALTRLVVLDLQGAGISTVPVVGSHATLEELDLSSNSIRSLDQLGGFVKLKRLNISNNLLIDVSALKNIPSLENLEVNANPLAVFPDLSLSSLRVFNARKNYFNGTVIFPTSLEEIDLSDSFGSVSLDFNDAALTDIRLRNAGVNSIVNVDLQHISQSLELSGNQLGTVDFLTTATNVRSLDLTNNLVTSLPDLSGLNQLIELRVSNNLLTKIDGSKLPLSLLRLSAASNAIEEFVDGPGLASLTHLEVRDNALGNEDVAVGATIIGLSGLVELFIQQNAADDLATLVATFSTIRLVSDEFRPKLLSLEMAPSQVLDLDENLQLKVTVVGEVFLSGEITLSSPKGQTISARIIGGTAKLNFSAYADQGEWQVSKINLRGPRHGTYNEHAIGRLFADLDTTVSIISRDQADLAAPIVESITVTPASVDLSSGPVLATMTTVVRDLVSGVKQATLKLRAGNVFANTYTMKNALGDTDALTFEQSFPIGFSDDSSIEIFELALEDYAGNETLLTKNDLLAMGLTPVLPIIDSKPATRTLAGGFIDGTDHRNKLHYKFSVDEASVVAFRGYREGSYIHVSLKLTTIDGVVIAESFDGANLARVGASLEPGEYQIEVSSPFTADYRLEVLGVNSDFVIDSEGDGIYDAEDLDDDNDGISDTKELELGLNPLNSSDAGGDLDGDHVSNLAELLALTDPLDKNSVPPSLSDLTIPDENLLACLTGIVGTRLPAQITFIRCSNRNISDLSGLEAFHSLGGINLTHNKLTNLKALSSLTRVENMDLRFNGLTDFQAIPVAPNLKYLDVSDNRLSSLENVGQFIRLQYLIASKNLFSDLSLTAMPASLERLIIDQADVTALPDLGNTVLTVLSARDNKLTEVKSLSASLDQLELRRNMITKLDLTGSSPSQIYISDNNIEQIIGLDVVPLSRFEVTRNRLKLMPDFTGTNLTEINLSDNRIETISDLRGALSLRRLDLSRNLVTRLDGSQLPSSLANIAAGKNRISEVSNLDELPLLFSLVLIDNHLDAADVEGGANLNQLTQLSNLFISANAILNVTQLKADLPETEVSFGALATLNTLSISPDPLDLNTSSSINVDIRGDNLFGFNTRVELTAPSGRIVGAAVQLNASSTVTLPLDAELGTWKLTHISSSHPFNDFVLDTFYPNLDRTIEVIRSE